MVAHEVLVYLKSKSSVLSAVTTNISEINDDQHHLPLFYNKLWSYVAQNTNMVPERNSFTETAIPDERMYLFFTYIAYGRNRELWNCILATRYKSVTKNIHRRVIIFTTVSSEISVEADICVWQLLSDIALQRPFEMWCHTRRNQISSFGETDESI